MIAVSRTRISVFLKGYGILGLICSVLGLVSTSIFSIFPIPEKNGNIQLFFVWVLLVHAFYAYIGYSLDRNTFAARLYDKCGAKLYLIILATLFVLFSAGASIILD